MPSFPYRSAIIDAPPPQPAGDEPLLPDRPPGARRSHIAATVAEVRHLVETTLMTYAEIAQRTGIPGRTVCHWASTRKWTRRAPLVPDRPRGPRRAHVAATVSEVRHLVETTLMTYAEIAQRTGVVRATIWKWSKTRKWIRPTFAPRWTHTVPAWRAGRTRRRRMLAVRLVALAERYIRTLEAASAVDAVRLREARALLAMARRATRPPTPRQRLLAAVRPVAEPKARARVTANPSPNGIDIARPPAKAVARNARRAPRAAPDRAVDQMSESPRQDGGPRPPHPAAIARADVPLAQRK
jgi:predicted transcriptional regulator